jgi:nucleoside-triphosphatase THEP1
MITIITGSRSVGKTTLLLKLIEELENKGRKPSGIMTPSIYDKDDNKIGFYALDIRSGEQWELGRSDKLLSGPSYGPFSFSEIGFIRANEIIEKVLTEGSADVFLDEIGPLELEKGYGFSPILSLINSFSINRNLYLVIRRSLIDDFVSRFISENEYRIIEITLENRERIVF